ncbi:hypothetical protein [Klebsiella oxytoca]|uniref:hypothetical protein n=1 Tax=Klebsiella oxytoca TaxID=571 RepID=UPI000667DD05|nr:hypothetical protein [Klebsiella oxytoca]
MNRRNMKIQGPVFWPPGDIYFGTGASVISECLREAGVQKEYYFMNLDRHTLRAFIRDFPGFRHDNVIIICSRRLLPLAFFWLKESKRVRAVFESSVSVKKIIQVLRDAGNDKPLPFTVRAASRTLSIQDLVMLRDYIEEGNMAALQRKYRCSSSTIYRRKMIIAKKFSVRKLAHVFSLR